MEFNKSTRLCYTTKSHVIYMYIQVKQNENKAQERKQWKMGIQEKLQLLAQLLAFETTSGKHLS